MNTTARVKSMEDGIVEGYAVIFDGEDLQGETFLKNTDFMLDSFPVTKSPVLFDHAYDSNARGMVLGKVIKRRQDKMGLWIEAQIDRAKDYGQALLELIDAGVMGISTGSVPQLVERIGKSITRWPIAEVSFTPVPAEPRTVEHVRARKSAALELLGIELKTQDVPSQVDSYTTAGVNIPVHLSVSFSNAADTSQAKSDEDEAPDASATKQELDRVTARTRVLELAINTENSHAYSGSTARERTEGGD